MIIAFNLLETTLRCLDSLLKYEKENEVFFLDNGSEEPVYENVKKRYSSFGWLIYRSEKNLGVVGGRNYLLKKASGKYLVFMDNDVELTEVVSQRIKNNLSDLAVGIYGQRGIMLSLDLRPFVVAEKEVDAVGGFFLCFRQDLLDKIGLLDENFKIYGQEDFDFCLRAKKAGFKIISDPSLPLIHHEHKSSSTLTSLEKYQRKNFQYFYKKWKGSLDILEVEKRKINYLSCLNCSETWRRGGEK